MIQIKQYKTTRNIIYTGILCFFMFYYLASSYAFAEDKDRSAGEVFKVLIQETIEEAVHWGRSEIEDALFLVLQTEIEKEFLPVSRGRTLHIYVIYMPISERKLGMTFREDSLDVLFPKGQLEQKGVKGRLAYLCIGSRGDSKFDHAKILIRLIPPSGNTKGHQDLIAWEFQYDSSLRRWLRKKIHHPNLP